MHPIKRIAAMPKPHKTSKTQGLKGSTGLNSIEPQEEEEEECTQMGRTQSQLGPFPAGPVVVRGHK